MRGKVGLVIGLAAGYVLGTRAGRERYEQIKDQALKVWNLDPVQEQVAKAKDFAKSAAMALPTTVWDSAVKVTKAAGAKGTPGQRLDADPQGRQGLGRRHRRCGRRQSADAVKDAADDAVDDISDAGRGGA